jgi:hypothetical protein
MIKSGFITTDGRGFELESDAILHQEHIDISTSKLEFKDFFYAVASASEVYDDDAGFEIIDANNLVMNLWEKKSEIKSLMEKFQ